MTKIAYKTNTNNPNLPNGFVTDHFETDQDTLEGYIVVDKSAFNQIIANNNKLMQIHESNKNIIGADPAQPPHPRRPNEHAEMATVNIMTERNKAIQQTQENIALFAEFMAWKNAKDSGSGSGSGTGS